MENLKDKTAIGGMGIYKFSKDSGISEVDMACRCVKLALDDAGLTPDAIDGFIEYSEEDFDEIDIARSMGFGNLTYYGDVRWDGGASSAMVLRAAMAVASGAANNVLVVRSVNDASLKRVKKDWGELRTWPAMAQTFYTPYGLVSDDGKIGMNVRRYIHEHNLNRDSFGWITKVLRENGAKNPHSLCYESPVTYEDYLESKVKVDPFRELDYSIAVDGAIAFIVTTAEKAKRMKHSPVYITAGAQSMVKKDQFKTSYYQPTISDLTATEAVGKKLFQRSGATHKDIDILQIEDEFAPLVPMQLEALGFCEKGKGIDFIEEGKRISLDGELPVNTSGGSIGEGNLHGMNHIADAVNQLRGTATSQIKDAEMILVATGAFGPSSGLILRR